MELAGWLHPEQLNVQMAISKKFFPQGSVLGLILCNVLNDADSGIRCIHIKSVD